MFLGVRAARAVIISTQSTECNVTFIVEKERVSFRYCAKVLELELRNHEEVITNLETAKKNVLLNLNAQLEQIAFKSAARVFRTAYYVTKNSRHFSDFESLVDL